MRGLRFFGPLVVASAVLAGAAACSKPKPVVLIEDAAPLNVTPAPLSSIEAQVNPQHLPAYSGPTGSVEGTIFVTGLPAEPKPADFKQCPEGAAVYDHVYREGKPATPNGPRWLADAVVAITGYANFFIPETKEAKLVTIANCAFSSRTVTMTFGQRLDVKNETNVFWLPALEPKSSVITLMAVPHGDPVQLFPKHEGTYLLYDRDRRWADTDMYVFRHPLHTVTALEGKYRIDGIPVGKVRVNSSHPRIPGTDAMQEVEIKPDAVLHVDLTLEHKALPKPDAGTPTGATNLK